jgi:hypothetical protein
MICVKEDTHQVDQNKTNLKRDLGSSGLMRLEIDHKVDPHFNMQLPPSCIVLLGKVFLGDESGTLEEKLS